MDNDKGEKVRTATLMREQSTSDGTFGVITLDDGQHWFSGELPWHDNAHGTSCIPEGTYVCKWFNSPKHGYCYQVYGVPDRNVIEIHSANFMGDLPKAKQLEGCIALGKSKGMLAPSPDKPAQMAILQSKVAIEEFEADLNGDDFELTIIES